MNVSSIQDEDLDDLSQAYRMYCHPNDTQYRQDTLKNTFGKLCKKCSRLK